jgi:hypothetical protein
LAADFTTANIPDNQMYSILTASLPFTMIKRTLYISADPGYDDHELYDLSTDMGFQLVYPVKRYRNTSSMERIKLVEFYESEVGQTIYSLRSISIEPLIEHIKSVFSIDPLPVRGYVKASSVVLLSILFYQILVYYNCKTRKDKPRAIKYMLGT